MSDDLANLRAVTMTGVKFPRSASNGEILTTVIVLAVRHGGKREGIGKRPISRRRVTYLSQLPTHDHTSNGWQGTQMLRTRGSRHPPTIICVTRGRLVWVLPCSETRSTSKPANTVANVRFAEERASTNSIRISSAPRKVDWQANRTSNPPGAMVDLLIEEIMNSL